MNTETVKEKELITLSSHRLIRTIPNNIKNIHAHLNDGNEILATWPMANRLSVLTKAEHISEHGDKYLAATKNGKGKKLEVFPAHLFFVGHGCSLLSGKPAERPKAG